MRNKYDYLLHRFNGRAFEPRGGTLQTDIIVLVVKLNVKTYMKMCTSDYYLTAYKFCMLENLLHTMLISVVGSKCGQSTGQCAANDCLYRVVATSPVYDSNTGNNPQRARGGI